MVMTDRRYSLSSWAAEHGNFYYDFLHSFLPLASWDEQGCQAAQPALSSTLSACAAAMPGVFVEPSAQDLLCEVPGPSRVRCLVG